ncbi:aerobic-type carbon monoxide dehydrogenase small subunit (CoxS/CutS family) [Mycobacterium frederiksbergense]|uniref:Aerobic-type carbon monoxide dehydrogenase small subunit (CoxS/CutS family) n=1 Tax=Mycolicibacterium frederiksbergense TaxID=117567 RepID=A0ABT6KYB4_9MYCO|nr:(2Fe-2S)-binding protein [Mycolicibacterium frederiksbergense]MDH6194825.1 aerobic-type carbon monoxide dehydrogenase small subunit (CoxS/CutS family) [Mycolicibacterium frederiksbergense]
MTFAIEVRVNGRTVQATVPPRLSLADFLRERLGLTGTHIGCGQGLCGSCNVLLDSRSVRSCLTLAVQADGTDVVTVEDLSGPELSTVQDCLVRHRALQCGFCTPGFVVLIEELLTEVGAGLRPTPEEQRDRLAASLCRCTGYAPVLAAVQELVAAKISEQSR